MVNPIGERMASIETEVKNIEETSKNNGLKIDALTLQINAVEKKIDRLMYLGLAFAVVGGIINEKTVDVFSRVFGG
jgi:hypothetical protein